MCELLGISSSANAGFADELVAFRQRGGLTADNPDGWGLAWWEEGDFALVKEASPAHQSTRLLRLGDSVRSQILVGHVRKANYPPVRTLNNTHPFRHVCCGKPWVFAHNGLVPEVVGLEQHNVHPVCRPAGETDSEFAFCHLLDHIAHRFDGLGDPEPAALLAALTAISATIACHGKFNFLLSDGSYLIAYGHDRLHYREWEAPAGSQALVATEPLPGPAGWRAFVPGELRLYRQGRLVGHELTRPCAQDPAGAGSPA